MKCGKCTNTVTSLHGIPIGRSAHMSDPKTPMWCYDCYVQDYGTDEEIAEWVEEHKNDPLGMELDRAIEADAFPGK